MIEEILYEASAIVSRGKESEEVIYAEGKTVSVFTLKKEKDGVRKAF